MPALERLVENIDPDKVRSVIFIICFAPLNISDDCYLAFLENEEITRPWTVDFRPCLESFGCETFLFPLPPPMFEGSSLASKILR